MRLEFRVGLLVAACLAVQALGCGPDDWVPCDPRLTDIRPMNAGGRLGPARDAAGAVYLVDRLANVFIPRLFVSEGEALVRRRVSHHSYRNRVPGSAQFMVTYSSDKAVMLVSEFGRDDRVSRMGLARGRPASDVYGLLPDDEILTLMSDESIGTFTWRNFPEPVSAAVASMADGRYIVCLSHGQENRLFMGRPDRLLEHDMLGASGSVEHQSCAFMLDGSQATVIIPLSGSRISAEVLIAGTRQPIVVSQVAGPVPDTFSYLCPREPFSTQLPHDPNKPPP